MDEVPLFTSLVRGLVILGLVAANAFFVSAEFSLVAASRFRLEELAKEGDRKAKLAGRAIQSLDRYVSATHLGSTLASIGLFWVAEPLVADLLRRTFGGLPGALGPVTTHALAATATFLLLTVMHVIFGKTIPKTIALLHPETTSRWVAGPLIGFATATNPLLSLLNRTADTILKVFGIPAVKTGGQRGHPREIMTLVKQSQESGLLDKQDVRLFEGILEFTEKTARDVMTPRTEVVALEADLTVEEAAARIAVEGRSRYPLIHGSLDDIVGVVHAKEVLTSLPNAKYQKIEEIMRDALFVPGSRAIEDLLGDMQRLKRHLAIVLDEYGGTAGIVTMEDLLEEIVGPIFDEYDEADAAIEPDKNATTLPGHMEIDEANDRFGFAIKSDHYTTVGGFVFGALGRLPKLGDRVPLKDATLEVIAMEERRVGTLRIWPGAPTAKERGRSEQA